MAHSNANASSPGPSQPTLNALISEFSTTTPVSHDTSIIVRREASSNSTHMGFSDHVRNGSLTLVTLFKDASALVPHAGPLSQILGVTKELIVMFNDMKDNKDGCSHIVRRVLHFVKSFSEELDRMKISVREGTGTASRLYILLQ